MQCSFLDAAHWMRPTSVIPRGISSAMGTVSPHSIALMTWQVDDEARAVHGVCKRLCPIHISLDRVIMTADGVLLGCWQVRGVGGDG